MSLIHRCLIALSLCGLVSCKTVPTAPEPAEFSLTAEQLKREYMSWRNLGIANLHGRRIVRDRDAQGNPAFLATGGGVLVKDSVPAIIAKAPEILLNADYAELRGRSVVKKQGLLYTGDADDSKIIIDGVFLRFEGPNSVKQISPAAAAPSEVAPPPPVEPGPQPVVNPQPVVTSPPVAAPQPRPSVRPPPLPVTNQYPAQPVQTKPKPKRVQPKPTQAKPTQPKPAAAAPKPAAPPVDRARVLQLMREPD